MKLKKLLLVVGIFTIVPLGISPCSSTPDRVHPDVALGSDGRGGQEGQGRQKWDTPQPQGSCPVTYEQVSQAIGDQAPSLYSTSSMASYPSEAEALVEHIKKVYLDDRCASIRPQVGRSLRDFWRAVINTKYEILVNKEEFNAIRFCQPNDPGCEIMNQQNERLARERIAQWMYKDRPDEILNMEEFFKYYPY